jgi:hypothetical protein
MIMVLYAKNPSLVIIAIVELIEKTVYRKTANTRPMDLEDLQSKLRELGVDIPQNTLKRWGYDGLIPRPERYKHGKGSKQKGRAASWSEDALTEAAAIWAIRNGKIIKMALLRKLIPYIKHSALHVYEYPMAVYALPVADPNRPTQRATYRSIIMTLPYDHYRDLEIPQPDQATWHSLLTTWIAAKEKAKRGCPINEKVQVILHWSSRKKDEQSWTFDLSSISLAKSESDNDEIIFLEDGIDTRERLWNYGLFRPAASMPSSSRL